MELSSLSVWTKQKMVAAFWVFSSETSDSCVAVTSALGHWSSCKERNSGPYDHFWEFIKCFSGQLFVMKLGD